MKFTDEQTIIYNVLNSHQRPIIRHTITGEEMPFDYDKWRFYLKNYEKVSEMTKKVRDQIDDGTYTPSEDLDKWTWQAMWEDI